MKKSTLKYVAEFIADYIDAEGGEHEVSEEMVAARKELFAELNKGEEKAAANRTLYESAKAIVLAALTDTPATAAEIYEAVKNNLPNGFSRSKVQYGLTNYWKNDVVRHDGTPATYTAR